MRFPVLAATLLALISLALSAPVFAIPINLIINGNAESGLGSSTGAVVVVPGWSTNSGFTSVTYGAASGFPTATSPGASNRGANFFAGGPSNAASSATQTISLSSSSAVINAGKALYDVSGWFGGFSTQNDNATLVATFRNGNGDVLNSDTIGGVSAIDRGNVTSFLFREHIRSVPIGAANVFISLNMVRSLGTDNDGYADNLSFSISTIPEPDTWTMMSAGLALLSLISARRKKILQR